MRRLVVLLLCFIAIAAQQHLPIAKAAPTNQTPAKLIDLPISPWQAVLALAWSPDGLHLAAGAGQSVYLYQTGNWERLEALQLPALVTGLAFHPDGAELAISGWDGHLRVYDRLSDRVGLDLAAHKKGANSVSYSPDGSLLATGGNDGMARLWNAASGSLVRELIGGSFGVPAGAFTLDGKELAIANAALVRMRDIATGRFTHTLSGEGSFYCLALHPAGRWLAGGNSQGQVWVWEISTGEIVLQLSDPQQKAALVWDVAFSPDGSLLAAAWGDGRVLVWQAESGALVAEWKAHSLAAASLAFSPDGRHLVTGGLEGVIRVWEADFQQP